MRDKSGEAARKPFTATDAKVATEGGTLTAESAEEVEGLFREGKMRSRKRGPHAIYCQNGKRRCGLKFPASAWRRRHSRDLSTPPQVASSFGVGRDDRVLPQRARRSQRKKGFPHEGRRGVLQGDVLTRDLTRDRGRKHGLKLPASAWRRTHSRDLSTPPRFASSLGVGRDDRV
jgi:hypothetical protein